MLFPKYRKIQKKLQGYHFSKALFERLTYSGKFVLQNWLG